MSELLDNLNAQLGDRYRLERELARGGMSRVFLAEELALGRYIVLKALPPELGSVMSEARFHREMRVAAKLQHPHIVPLLASGFVEGMPYYTMPFIDGESVRARLDRENELPVADAIQIIRDVADALAYAHGEGVIHRDVKPDNILLSHRHAMVTDFGVARALSEAATDSTLTHTGIAVGTPAYMAPEQAAGEPLIDQRADIYALGVVAYELLAGMAPFRAGSVQALVAAQLTQTPVSLAVARPGIPAAVADVVHRCLEKRPADRFQDANGLIAALDRAGQCVGDSFVDVSSGIRNVSAQDASRPRGVSRRAAIAGGAAAGLLGVVAGNALGAGAGSGTGFAATASPTFQRLTFRRGLIRTARFAPDSHTVLYGALWDGGSCRVYTVRDDNPESSFLDLPDAAPLSISSKGELALSLGQHRLGIMPYGTLARVPLAGGAPRELQEHVKYADWSPDGLNLALVRRVDDHDVLEYPVGRVIAEPERASGGFSFVRVAPDGASVAAFELDQRMWLTGRVVIVDREGRRRSVSRSFFNVFGLAWRGTEVWFTAADALPLFRNTLYAMNVSGDVRIITRIPGNVSLHDIAPDGRVLLARTDDRGGMTFNAGAGDDRDMSWLDATVLADMSADGRIVLFTESGVGGGSRPSAYTRTTDGAAAVRLGGGTALSLSPDTRWAILQTDAEATHLEIVPTGAGTAERLERAGLHIFDARWLGDGEKFVARASTDRGVQLFVLGRDDDSVRALTPAGEHIPSSGWAASPDGSAVAVHLGQQLWVYAVSDGSSRVVPGDHSGSQLMRWIDDGLLVTDTSIGDGTVHRVDPLTGARAIWTRVAPRDPAGIMNVNLDALAATRDGRMYSYSWHRALSDLYLAEGWG